MFGYVQDKIRPRPSAVHLPRENTEIDEPVYFVTRLDKYIIKTAYITNVLNVVFVLTYVIKRYLFALWYKAVIELFGQEINNKIMQFLLGQER